MTDQDLIKELLDDPASFAESKSLFDLLSAYYDGLDLDTLRPLMRHSNAGVRRTAVWIASELGAKAGPLLDEALYILRIETDPLTRFLALEIVTLSSADCRSETFAHVCQALADADGGIRRLTMLLVGNSSRSQIEHSRQVLRSDSHQAGLHLLLEADRGEASELPRLLKSSDPLMRKYAAIAAYRLLKRSPSIRQDRVITTALEVEDPEVKHFIQKHIGT